MTAADAARPVPPIDTRVHARTWLAQTARA